MHNDKRGPSKEGDWNIRGLGETLRKIKIFGILAEIVFFLYFTVLQSKTCMVLLFKKYKFYIILYLEYMWNIKVFNNF